MPPRLTSALAAAALLATAPALAAAQTVVVTPSNTQGWAASGVNTGSSTGITGTNPRSGDGSLQMSGTQTGGVAIRTRYELRVADYATTGASYGKLADLESFSFDWFRSGASTVGGVQSPAFRLLLRNGTGLGATYSEMIWDWSNNHAAGVTNAPVDAWQSVTTSLTSGSFYRYISGNVFGLGTKGNQLANCTYNGSTPQTPQTLQTWVATCAAGADVIGMSAGVGSVPAANGQTFVTYADNIGLRFAGQSQATVYNFETSVGAAVVPEPSTWALLGTGLLAVGGAAARRRRAAA